MPLPRRVNILGLSCLRLREKDLRSGKPIQRTTMLDISGSRVER